MSDSLSCAAAYSTFLTLNAAQVSISCSLVKRQPQAWRTAEVKEAVSERHKVLAAAHRSDEDRQAYVSVSRHASSVRQATCSSAISLPLSLKYNPTSVYSFLRFVAGSSSSFSSSHYFFKYASSRESVSAFADYLRFQFSVSKPNILRDRARGYLPSSAKPPVLRSLIYLSAPSFLSLNFLRLPPTSASLLPLTNTKLPIQC